MMYIDIKDTIHASTWMYRECFDKLNKPDISEHILYDSIYMKHLEQEN